MNAAAQYTPEQVQQLQKDVARIAGAVMPIVGPEDPHRVVMALLDVIVAAAQHTQYTRDMLVALLVQSYDRMQTVMQQLPADFPDRLQKLIADNPDKQPGELFQQLMQEVQQALTPPQ